MVKLVLVSAALPFSLKLMPGFQSRGNVWPESLWCSREMCGMTGELWQPYLASKSLRLPLSFEHHLDAGKLGRRPQKSPQKQLEEGSELLWHTLLKTSLKMNHCRGWDVYRSVLNQKLLEQFWFTRWVCKNLCRWLLFQQAYQGFICIFFPVEENIQSSRDSEAN